MVFDPGFILEAAPAVLAALPTTLLMIVIAAPLGWLLGFALAQCRLHRVPVLNQLVIVFVSMMRSVPEVVMLYVMYYFMPVVLFNAFQALGFSVNVAAVPAIAFAIVSFTLNQAAFSCEVLRSAIASVDVSQLEAALSVGMTRGQAMRRVVLPQAIVSALPNLNGLLVGLLQGTSLAYFVGVHEVMAVSVLEANQSYAYLEAYLLTTIIYEVLSFAINRIFHVVELRAGRYRRPAPATAAKGAGAEPAFAPAPAPTSNGD